MPLENLKKVLRCFRKVVRDSH